MKPLMIDETGRSRIANPWGPRTPYGRGDVWPARVDMQLAQGITPLEVERWVPSASVLHSNGDALDIAVKQGRIVGVRGRACDRINRGRLDPKDLFGWRATADRDRLTTPLHRVDGQLVPCDWDTAMTRIVQRTKDLLETSGPEAIGFYTSGQLFLEEYYTLATLARGGIGTNHLDGDTRLCTATAAESLKQSFGCDGQPGSYDDFDDADVIALYGHNVAESQSVLWARILDRLAGPHPPALLCVDPRHTPAAQHATVHLAPRPGTNMALMNALLHELIECGWIDRDYIAAHTVGFDDLAAAVAEWPAERAARICDVDEQQIHRAACLLGTTRRLVSTVLQGFYQSHQATAATVQVNNIHLVRGMLGKPGCGVLQMNGQPAAQNTRECGADGDLPGFRNWANPEHIGQLAQLWNVEPEFLSHGKPPTHAMRIMRLAETGDLGMLWVSATNPAISLPELSRIRRILSRPGLFLVAQDIYPTETTALADVVLPAAAWGEKTGTFTNADRTVHLSERAVDPPGRARSDLAIFVDFARRMDLRDRDGNPLPSWDDERGAYAAWQRCSAGRPCDYTGLSYELLRNGGVQWPRTDRPDDAGRLYANGAFFARPDECESYGKDLLTGEPWDEQRYRGLNPDGKAMIKTAPYLPSPEPPSSRFPLALITGSTIYHSHTRTKTGRTPQLRSAAPDVWAEISSADAAAAGIADNDLIEIRTARGALRAHARVTGMRPGVVFLPIHYGYWDMPDADVPEAARTRAANELTSSEIDPVSGQPLYKTAAAQVRRVVGPSGAPAPYRGLSPDADAATRDVPATDS